MQVPKIQEGNRLLPHRNRMLLVDILTGICSGTATAEALIREDNPFLNKGFLERCAILEYAAQTVAAFIGHDQVIGGGTFEGGLLVGLDRVTFHGALPRAGDKLRMTIREIASLGSFGSYDFVVDFKSSRICTGILKVMSGMGS